MVAKRKNVDTIAAPKAEVEKTQTVQPETEPLLSIIEPETVVQSEKSPKNYKKTLLWSLGVSLFVFSISGLLVWSTYYYEKSFKDKAFLGVKVWGMDVGGKNVTEIQEAITEKTKSYKVTIKGPDQNYTATAEDLGVIYDSESMMTEAMAKGRSGDLLQDNLKRIQLLIGTVPVSRLQKIVYSEDLVVNPVVTVNQEIFDKYVMNIADNININAQDSQVTVAAGSVQLKPAIYGRAVEVETLKNQIRSSIDGFVTEEIEVKTSTVKPSIIDTAAQEVMIQAQNVMQRPVVLTYQGVEYRPNQETVASWITFTKKAGEAKYTLVVDPAKMKGYFDFLGSKINVYPVSRKIRVENESKETETRSGSNGLLVDTAQLGKLIAEKLPNQASVAINIPTYVANYKTEYERVIIADWDKYIDVNISTQTMTACEKGGVNCRQWYVMTGKNSTPTPIGTWLVQQPAHSSFFWMSGLQGTPEYYRLWVPYATWFKGGGYAIHSASWRNNDINSANGFGNQAYTWNGSHGCVNAPDDAAKYIFDWAVTGTPVIVHY